METLRIAVREHRLQERVEQISSLLEKRIAKGIGNRDPSLWRNFGFFETEAVEIDFGNYVARTDLQEAAAQKKEWARYMDPLHAWLAQNASSAGVEPATCRLGGDRSIP